MSPSDHFRSLLAALEAEDAEPVASVASPNESEDSPTRTLVKQVKVRSDKSTPIRTQDTKEVVVAALRAEIAENELVINALRAEVKSLTDRDAESQRIIDNVRNENLQLTADLVCFKSPSKRPKNASFLWS